MLLAMRFPESAKRGSALASVGASSEITAEPALRPTTSILQAASNQAGRGPLRVLSDSTAKRVARRAPSMRAPTASCNA